MSLIKFTPLRQYLGRNTDLTFPAFWDEVNDMVKSFSDTRFPESNYKQSFVPALNVSDRGTSIVVSAELPGMKDEDIHVSVDDGILYLKGEKKSEDKIEEENYIRVERSFGSFHRSIMLPSDVDAEKINAVYQNGILTVTLPKTVQEKKEHKIKIKTL